MTKGYSYLVINDFILPDQGPAALAAEYYMMMLVLLSGMERSALQWWRLVKSAGLKVGGLYQPPGDGQRIIVAALG